MTEAPENDGAPIEAAEGPRVAVSRRLVCPVCRGETLVGTTWTVPEEDIRLDAHFLPHAVAADRGAGDGALVPLHSDFLCPEDLYAAVGPVAEVDGVPRYPDNGWARLARLYRPRNLRLLGQRARFLVEALFGRRLDPRRLIPAEAAEVAGGVEVFLDAWRLLDACVTPREAASEIGRRFDAIKRLGWNPFAALAERIGAEDGDAEGEAVRAAVLDLELADLFYLLRRQIDRRAAYPSYAHLPESLVRAKNLVQHVRGLDADLIADLLFHVLRMAGQVDDPDRRRLYLETAYHCAGYVLRKRFQPGSDPNRRLDRPGGNPDVLLLLTLRLGRELGFSPGDEEVMIGLLHKRLETVPAYSYPDPKSPVAMRTARIGREIRRHLADLPDCGPVFPSATEAAAPA